MTQDDTGSIDAGDRLVSITLPVWWTFAGLIGGLVLGTLLGGRALAEPIGAALGPVGELWLRALQVTIVPLVAALLTMGISRMAQAARAGAVARRFLLLVALVLVLGGLVTILAMPALLSAFPIPAAANAVLRSADAGTAQEVPGVGAFISSLVAPNIVAAASETAMLPLTLFFAVFALAMTRLPEAQRQSLRAFFHALANVMLVMIGWVLKLAPVGVFALAVGVGIRAGGGAFATLIHYILTVAAMGGVVLIAAYILAATLGKCSLVRFARAMLPAQAVAISTQSSLASLPAMLASARELGVADEVRDFTLPLAVAIFRATSPAMNLAVAIYVAYLTGVTLTPLSLAAGLAVAFVIAIGSVSLPGSISFVISIGPIASAMGVPIEPLALLVAVEMLPDLMRTVANVTMNVAVTTAAGARRRTE